MDIGLIFMVAVASVAGVFFGSRNSYGLGFNYLHVIAAVSCYVVGMLSYAKTAVILYGLTYGGYVVIAIIAGVIVTIVTSSISSGIFEKSPNP